MLGWKVGMEEEREGEEAGEHGQQVVPDGER